MLKLHQMFGTGTVLVQNLLGNSDLPLWDAVSQQELPEMGFPGLQGCSCVLTPTPPGTAQLRSLWQLPAPHTCKLLPLVPRYIPVQCLSAIGEFGV